MTAGAIDPRTLGAIPHADGLIARLACARARATGIALPAAAEESEPDRQQVDDSRVRLAVRDGSLSSISSPTPCPTTFSASTSLSIAICARWGCSTTCSPPRRPCSMHCGAPSGTSCSSTKACCSMSSSAGSSVSHSSTWGSAVISTAPVGVLDGARASASFASSRGFTSAPAACALFRGRRLPRSSHRSSAETSDSVRRSMRSASREPSAAPASSAAEDPYLHKLLVGYYEDALARRRTGRGSFRASVENAIVPLPPHGEVRIGEIARRARPQPTNTGTASERGRGAPSPRS